jgi:hypothetical protein
MTTQIEADDGGMRATEEEEEASFAHYLEHGNEEVEGWRTIERRPTPNQFLRLSLTERSSQSSHLLHGLADLRDVSVEAHPGRTLRSTVQRPRDDADVHSSSPLPRWIVASLFGAGAPHLGWPP